MKRFTSLQLFRSRCLMPATQGQRCLCSSDSDLSYLSQKSYWTKKYKTNQQHTFDWLLDFTGVQEHLLQLLETKGGQSQISVLDLGCGTSTLVSSVLRSSPVPVTAFCVDYSISALLLQQRLAVEAGQKGNTASSSNCIMADATQLPLRPCTIEVIIDKGTTDSVLKDRDKGVKTAGRILQECLRVLTPTGTLLQITDEDPDLRMPLLETSSREMGLETAIAFRTLDIGQQGMEYFMYLVDKDKR